jgi:hypothetical protein
MRLLIAVIIVVLLHACTTSYLEMQGECVWRNWGLFGWSVKRDIVCDMPAPGKDEEQVREREMNTIQEELEES